MNRFAGRIVRMMTISIMTCLFLAVSAYAAEGQLAFDTGTTTGAGLRLRSEASTEASIVTTLDSGWVLAVLDDSVDGWYQVAYDGNTGYVSGDYFQINSDNSFKSYGRVNANSVNLRSEPNTNGGVVTSMSEGDVVTATSLVDGWYAVSTASGSQGYIRSDLLDLTNSASSSTSSSSGGNSSIVSTAKQYLGTRYVYGGASPSGFDCSGFTMYVYRQYGYSLPHTATGQWQSGLGTRVYSISALQPGDLVFFNDPARNAGKACSHAGIYVGNGQIVHASSSRSGGVITSSLTSGYYNQYFVGGIHV